MNKIKSIILIIVILLSMTILTSCEKQPTVYEYIESDIIIETGEYKLPGKLTMPEIEDKVPAVVFVHGSGASDMNESIGALKLFEELAIKLAKKGIASIRYDKRSYVYKEQLATKLDFTIYDEVIDDAVSAINQLQLNENIGDIYVIGHSFGGQLAPVIVNKTNIKGVIILAGTTEHIIDIAMNQLKEQNSPYYDIYDPYDEYFKNIKEVIPSEVGYYFMGAFETYWVSYNNIDLNKEILQCVENKKMLILQGGLDLQVKASTLDTYKTLLKNTNAKFKLYETLNHMFVDGTGETITTAYQVYKPVSEEVVNDIVDFIGME